MKCELAASLIHGPQVIFLDEPTIGLDVLVQDRIFSFLNQINKKFGSTIILTTHEVQNIERFCQRIILLSEGQVIYDGPLTQFSDMDDYRRLCIPLRSQVNWEILEGMNYQEEGDKKVYILPKDQLAHLPLQEVDVAELTVEKLSLEDLLKKKLQGEKDEIIS